MDDHSGWLARFVQFFGPLLAAWSAFLAFIVHLRKLRNAEKAASHERILEELDRAYAQRDVAREECELALDKRAEAEAERIKWMGRAVKAEAIVQGYGEARQLQAIDEAQKRIEGSNGGGDA